MSREIALPANESMRGYLEDALWKTNGRGQWFKRGWFMLLPEAYVFERLSAEEGTVPYRMRLSDRQVRATFDRIHECLPADALAAALEAQRITRRAQIAAARQARLDGGRK